MNPAHPDIVSVVEAAYRQHFEVAPARASVSFLGVDPIEVLRFGDDGCDHYISLGMSRYPMADAADLVVDAGTAPRAELLITASGRPDEVWRQLAVLAAAPAVEGAVYAVGNRVDLSTPLVPGARATGGVLAVGPLRPIAVAGIADIAVLQLVPATAIELAWARVHGSDALQERWRQQHIDLRDLAREPVDLT